LLNTPFSLHRIIQVVVQVAPPQKARNKARRKHRQRKLDNYSDVSSCDDYSSDDDVSPYRSAKREQEPKNLGKPLSATPSVTEAFDYENKWTNGICNCCSNVTGCCFAHLCTVCYACRLFDKAHVGIKSLISGPAPYCYVKLPSVRVMVRARVRASVSLSLLHHKKYYWRL